jgi:hypothetical protein
MRTGRNGKPIVRRTRADVGSRWGETAGDKSCKDVTEALISGTRYQMFLLCSDTDDWAYNQGRLRSGAELGRVG